MKKAVITGDIINSTALEQEVFVELIHKMEDFIVALKENFDVKAEIYRGDSIQILVDQPKNALKVALLLKTYIKGKVAQQKIKFNTKEFQQLHFKPIFDIRIAIGIGEVENEQAKLSVSQGEAFQLSGRLLDSMKNKQTLAIKTNDANSTFLGTSLSLLDWQMNSTTQPQNEVLYHKLEGFTEVQIASFLGVNQSAVNQRSNAAGWQTINDFIQKFEHVYA